jgi:hypothetical protein
MARVFPLNDDAGAMPSAPPMAPRRDLLVVVICAAVFAAEFGVVLGGIWGLFPVGPSSVIGGKTPSVAPLTVAEGIEVQSSPDAEGMLSAPAGEPLSGPSSAPPTQLTPVDYRVTSAALAGAKVHRHRASVSHSGPSANDGDRHLRSYLDRHAFAIRIYQPGGRLPGW